MKTSRGDPPRAELSSAWTFPSIPTSPRSWWSRAERSASSSRTARSSALEKLSCRMRRPFDTVKLLPAQDQLRSPNEGLHGTQGVAGNVRHLPRHGAILHLFVAVDAEKVVNGKKLADHASWRAAEDEISKNPAHLIVQDWGRSMQDSQNLCSFFIPSLLDRSVCPEGKHVIHVYSSGGEPPTRPGVPGAGQCGVRSVQRGAGRYFVEGVGELHPRRQGAGRVPHRWFTISA